MKKYTIVLILIVSIKTFAFCQDIYPIVNSRGDSGVFIIEPIFDEILHDLIEYEACIKASDSLKYEYKNLKFHYDTSTDIINRQEKQMKKTKRWAFISSGLAIFFLGLHLF